MIEFQCPECCKGLRVKPELAGRAGKCPGCGVKICVPQYSSLANELPAEWLNDPAASIASEDFPIGVSGAVPTNAADLALMPSQLPMILFLAVGLLCLLVSPLFFFGKDPSMPALLALLAILLGLFFVGAGIYCWSKSCTPILKFSREGLYYSLIKKTIPWRDIQEAYYWNSLQDVSGATRVVVVSITGNRFGINFIKVRFTPEGRRRHKRLVHWTIDVTVFAEDDMVISLGSMRLKDLKSIDIAGEINKRVRT